MAREGFVAGKRSLDGFGLVLRLLLVLGVLTHFLSPPRAMADVQVRM